MAQASTNTAMATKQITSNRLSTCIPRTSSVRRVRRFTVPWRLRPGEHHCPTDRSWTVRLAPLPLSLVYLRARRLPSRWPQRLSGSNDYLDSRAVEPLSIGSAPSGPRRAGSRRMPRELTMAVKARWETATQLLPRCTLPRLDGGRGNRMARLSTSGRENQPGPESRHGLRGGRACFRPR